LLKNAGIFFILHNLNSFYFWLGNLAAIVKQNWGFYLKIILEGKSWKFFLEFWQFVLDNAWVILFKV